MGDILTSEQEVVLQKLLAIEVYQSLAIRSVLGRCSNNETLLSQAIKVLGDVEDLDSIRMADSEISEVVMVRMLTHASPKVRGAASVGEWLRPPKKTICPEVRSYWRVAMRDINCRHYALPEIFKQDPGLAFEWLVHQLQSANAYVHTCGRGMRSACEGLTHEQRKQVLQKIGRKTYSSELFDSVVGDNPELFRDWLIDKKDEWFRYLPLDRPISSTWEQMALIALDSGMSPEELAEYAVPRSWEGNLMKEFEEAIPVYQTLVNHADPRLHEAGKKGLEFARTNLQKERERQRRQGSK